MALHLPDRRLARMHIGSVIFANKPGDGSGTGAGRLLPAGAGRLRQHLL